MGEQVSEDAKAELYRFVRDRHDKFLQARQGQKARVGHLLILTGFVVTISITFGLPNLIGAIREAGGWASLITSLAAVAFVIVLVYLSLVLREHLRYLARLSFSIPNANPAKIMGAFDAKEIQAERVYKSLTKMYLDAIERK